MKDTVRSPLVWWESRRPLYNAGLVIAGVLAFACYVVVCCTLLPRVLPASRIHVTFFTTLFQGIGYLVMMGVANVCYFLGPITERIVRPNRVERYRRICFNFGFWFSVLVPFSIPILLTILVLYCPSHWKG
jgi:hypothetical protein